MVSSACLALVAFTTILAASQATPVRDAHEPPRSGTASIAGRVISDGHDAAPIRRVTVTLGGSAGGGRTAVTTDDGRFEFSGLAAGRYFVTATKPAYVPTAFGLTRPLRAGAVPTGVAIVLGGDQRLTDLVLRMARGAVITGVVRGRDGSPLRGVHVSLAFPLRAGAAGERVMAPVANASDVTDSRGVYRVFGIPPGEYVVVARPGGPASDLEMTTAADVQRAISGAGGAGGTTAGTSADAPRRPTFGYSPIYHPGTPVAAEAIRIAVGAGEERGGVDFHFQPVANSHISGAVSNANGGPAAGIPVTLSSDAPGTGGPVAVRTVRTNAAGEFGMTGVAPGQYRLGAATAPAEGRGGSAAPMAWARQDVSVWEQDVHVTLQLQPGLTLSGRVVFEAPATGAAPDPSGMQVSLVSDTMRVVRSGVTAVGSDGRFTMTGLLPGRYRIAVTTPVVGVGGHAWLLKSGVVDGRDAVDDAIELRAGVEPPLAVVTMTSRLAELSGSIHDGDGRPAPEFFILAFPADRGLWGWNSRRIRHARPASDGTFVFRNLPAGEYRIGAVTDVEPNEWFDQSFLERLLSASIAVTLADGERKVQNIRLRRP